MSNTPDTTALRARVEELEAVLRIVAHGIHRDRTMNACWIHGTALAVHAVESALGIKPPARRKEKPGKPAVEFREDGHEWARGSAVNPDYLWCRKCLLCRRADGKGGPCTGHAKLRM